MGKEIKSTIKLERMYDSFDDIEKKKLLQN